MPRKHRRIHLLKIQGVYVYFRPSCPLSFPYLSSSFPLLIPSIFVHEFSKLQNMHPVPIALKALELKACFFSKSTFSAAMNSQLHKPVYFVQNCTLKRLCSLAPFTFFRVFSFLVPSLLFLDPIIFCQSSYRVSRIYVLDSTTPCFGYYRYTKYPHHC